MTNPKVLKTLTDLQLRQTMISALDDLHSIFDEMRLRLRRAVKQPPAAPPIKLTPAASNPVAAAAVTAILAQEAAAKPTDAALTGGLFPVDLVAERAANFERIMEHETAS